MSHHVHVLLALPLVETNAELEWTLRRQGFGVTSVGNGAEVVRHLASCTVERCPLPDLLVVHEDLAGWDGVDLDVGLGGSEWECPVILLRSRRGSRVAGAGSMRPVHAVLASELHPGVLFTAILTSLPSGRLPSYGARTSADA